MGHARSVRRCVAGAHQLQNQRGSFRRFAHGPTAVLFTTLFSSALFFCFLFSLPFLFLMHQLTLGRLTGKDRVKFLEGLVVADLQALAQNHATLSVFTNEKGGIIDDTIITNR